MLEGMINTNILKNSWKSTTIKGYCVFPHTYVGNVNILI